MKVVFVFLAALAMAYGFAPASNTQKVSVALNAETSRKAFMASVFSAAFIPLVASAGTMSQENVFDPTEQWETGSPTPEAAAARSARFMNARTQMTSSFPPIKRLTLERKSPVTRLDINAPYFEAYQKTYPGLYKRAASPAPAEEAPPAPKE